MSEIPEDILEMARRVATEIAGLVADNADARLVATDGAIGIATALMAERERCAGIARTMFTTSGLAAGAGQCIAARIRTPPYSE